MQLRAFTAADLGEAGALLARRHAAHRALEPLLDNRFTDPDTAGAEVAELWDRPDASGAVAFVGGRMVGYLVGVHRPGDGWGPNVWVEPAGYAVEEPETVRDLYGMAAQRWVDEGHRAHYAIVPAGAAEPWYRLAFGQQQVYAMCEPYTPESGPVPVRRARPGDLDALAELDLELPVHQRLSPVFSAKEPPTLDEAREDWSEVFEDTRYPAFVAELDGEVVGLAYGCDLTLSGMHTGPARPDNAGYLSFAVVRPHARGRGIGGALGRAVLAWCAEAGYRAAVTDWRATNLLSSRAWPRLGFRPTFHRLHRLVGY
jgi:GNAT superfamily N-acetyltransferase